MNFSPTEDIPCLEELSDAINTFSPFCHKLICTWDPEPMSSNANLDKTNRSLCYLMRTVRLKQTVKIPQHWDRTKVTCFDFSSTKYVTLDHRSKIGWQ